MTRRNTTRRASSSGVVVALLTIVALAACGGGSTHSTASGPGATTTVNRVHAPAGPIAPLTGLVDATGASTKRCAITVKVDNTPEARPQYGIDQADVVYEEVVEGGITR